MRFAVLGTGVVGRTLGTKLIDLGHQVTMGARSADNTNAAQWVAESGPEAANGTFADAAAAGEMVINATAGAVSLEALASAGAGNLGGKVIIDVANALDFSRGMPPRLSIVNDTSVGEEIQRAFPDARVVKALNTMNCGVMVNPALVPQPHDVFVCGNDVMAKLEVTALLRDFGWPANSIIDLGGITSARGMEMYVIFWVLLRATVGQVPFNIHVAR